MKSKVIFKFENFVPPKANYGLPDLLHTSRGHLGNFMMESQQGFRYSQVVDSILYFYENHYNTDDTVLFENSNTDTKPYIIPVAVQYSPYDWTDINKYGLQDPNKKSVFELINAKYLKDLQNKNALLLIDQSVEGYSAPFLWKWFHDKCKKYSIDPASILYLTGDQSCKDRYYEWCKKNAPGNLIKVIPSISLSMYLHKHYVKRKMNIKFNDLLDYKFKNKDNLYLFDCTNMRPRPHRILNFLHIIHNNLLEKCNLSMSSQKEWEKFIDINYTPYFTKYGLPADIMSRLQPDMTPVIAKHNYDLELNHYYNFVERILDDLYKNSWVSLISESSFFDHEYNAFISEKTFKPIACMQPFIILGSKNILKYLHKLGYKSFSPYINESYSLENDGSRIGAIMNTIKQIENIDDKIEWYSSMKDILEHNHNMFVEIGSKKSLEHTEIFKYYFEYFKDKNV